MRVFLQISPLVPGIMSIYTWQCPLTMAHRSVYLHNNQLTDAGLPDHMFNGSDNLEIITMSSNFLQVVPRNMPSTLYRLHLKVQHLLSLVSDVRWMMYILSLFNNEEINVDNIRTAYSYRVTSWRKSQRVPLTTCQTSESCISRTTISAMRAWITRLSGGQILSLTNAQG